jgi:hypothetical protein
VLNFERNTINTFVCTLSELSEGVPYYLFTFTEEMTNKTFNIVLEDTSLHPERYNMFELDIPQDINLGQNGFYTYEVRTQDNNVNLDSSLADKLVETGRMRLNGSRIAEATFTQTNENEQYERQ